MLRAQSRILDPNYNWSEHVVAWFQNGYACSNLSAVGELDESLRPGIAVAICTYKRARCLSRFLDSLISQDRKPRQLIVIDASSDDETERVLKARRDLSVFTEKVLYVRVSGPLRGLTRQRNLALRTVSCDLVAFFDDDTVLKPSCLKELEDSYHRLGTDVVGVAPHIWPLRNGPPLKQRVLRMLCAAPSLRPGSYSRSGCQIGWEFLEPTESLLPADWLPGCAMWKTAIAREVGFDEHFTGYANAEDLAFSLKMAFHGELFVVGKARLDHLHEPAGRPDPYDMGYHSLQNAYFIHRNYLAGRTWLDTLRFFYAYALDLLFRTGWLLIKPTMFRARYRFLAGRVRSFRDLLQISSPAFDGCRGQDIRSHSSPATDTCTLHDS